MKDHHAHLNPSSNFSLITSIRSYSLTLICYYIVYTPKNIVYAPLNLTLNFDVLGHIQTKLVDQIMKDHHAHPNPSSNFSLITSIRSYSLTLICYYIVYMPKNIVYAPLNLTLNFDVLGHIQTKLVDQIMKDHHAHPNPSSNLSLISSIRSYSLFLIFILLLSNKAETCTVCRNYVGALLCAISKLNHNQKKKSEIFALENFNFFSS